MSRNGVEIAVNGKRIAVSDCKHCEHLTAYWEDTSGKHKRWQCCHCGRIRDEYVPISRGFDTVGETGGHGPFLPQSRFAEQTGTSDDRDPVWRCKDGREMRVSEMETRHIINSICMIRRSPIRNGRRWRERYLPALRRELQERMRRAEQEELEREHR